MTRTSATIAVPPAVFELLHETMEELGQQRRFTNLRMDDGRSQVAIDFDGIAVHAGVADDRDTFINSGRLSDLMVQSNEEAFREGFEAGYYHDKEREGETSYYPAWSAYTPSADILQLQSDL